MRELNIFHVNLRSYHIFYFSFIWRKSNITHIMEVHCQKSYHQQSVIAREIDHSQICVQSIFRSGVAFF